jgi:hypothetical protein
VPGFDAELYLRLLGERLLADRDDQSRGARRPWVAEAAAALVAVDAIAPDRAGRVLDDYRLAATLRTDPHFRRHAMLGASPQASGSETKPLGPRRVVPCAHTIEQPQATLQVRYVSLSEEATAVAITWYPNVSRPWRGAPPSVTLTDDRGTTEAAPFSGGASREGMNGRLIPARPLAADTAWIEVDGVRLELSAEGSRFDASLERMPAEDPAARYLWRRISEPGAFYEHDVEPAIDALVAAGALAVDDPVLDDVRTVLDAIYPGGPHGAPAPPPGLSRLREPWHSVLARHGREDGPTGSIVLGAVTPAFDGFSVAVLELQSGERGFWADVEVAPGAGHGMPFDWGMGPRQLAWWAKDDRGNHYLGRRGTWSFNADYGSGLIEFQPALDPVAMQLELRPSGETTRAVISFSLPWVREHAGTTESEP